MRLIVVTDDEKLAAMFTDETRESMPAESLMVPGSNETVAFDDEVDLPREAEALIAGMILVRGDA